MTQLPGGQPAPAARTRPRPPWLILGLVAGFIGLPILEVWLLLQVGHAIGAWPTVGILIAEAVLGAWLMKREGRRAWRGLRDAFGSGRMPTGELASAGLVLVGGVMLLLPGFLTDLVGLFFLLPFTRPLARRLLGLLVASRVRAAGVDVDLIRAQVDRSNTIEGEVEP